MFVYKRVAHYICALSYFIIMKQFNLQEYRVKEHYSGAGELDVEILELENNEPDKRTKDWKLWAEHLNKLYSLYNEKLGFKVYKRI